MTEAGTNGFSLQTLDRQPVKESGALTLEQEVEVIGTEIDRGIASIRARRQDLIHEELRRSYHAALTNEADKVSVDRILAELQAVTAQVQESVSGVRARLESLVRQQIVHAVEAALGDGGHQSSPGASAGA